jgi:hypothetical protein
VVEAGTWATYWETLQDDGYIILIGNPSSPGDVWNEIEYLIAKYFGDTELLERMIESDRYRFATVTQMVLAGAPPGVIPPASDDQVIVMLTKPYPADHWRALAMLKSLKVKVLENSVEVIYPESKESFTVDAVNRIGCSVYAELVERVPTMGVKISHYDDGTTPHQLTPETGLADDEVSVGKYIDVWLSDNVQDLAGGVDNIEQATLKIYYTALELDGTPGKNARCTEPGDINEQTLCLYRWDETQETWVKLSDNLGWVNSVGVDTNNVTLANTEYEGYIHANVGHLSLYALAGKIRPHPEPAEQKHFPTAAEVEKMTVEEAVAAVENMPVMQSAMILKELSVEKAAEVTDGLSTQRLIGVVQVMEGEWLLDILPQLSVDKLYGIPPEVLFESLPNIPTEHLVGEVPPEPPTGFPRGS